MAHVVALQNWLCGTCGELLECTTAALPPEFRGTWYCAGCKTAYTFSLSCASVDEITLLSETGDVAS